MKTKFLWIVFSILQISTLFATDINPRFLNTEWNASWITHPESLGEEYEIVHFRKVFSLSEKPDEFNIHVSADNRYRLFVNGEAVCFGPARGDISHWYFETVDIAEYLYSGENTIAAVVWNFASDKPVAQLSVQTAFIVQGNSDFAEVVNTDTTWKVQKNESFSPYSISNLSEAYYVVGSGEKIDGNLYPWDWEKPGFKDEDWTNSKIIANGSPIKKDEKTWTLLPRDIPFLAEKEIRFKKVVRTLGEAFNEGFIQGNTLQVIPANSKIIVLFDQQELTIAYPELIVSGGKNSKITLTYAEALLDGKNKVNRNQVGSLMMKGNSDSFITDGGEKRMYRPCWFRTYRYVQMEIETADEELILEDLRGIYTAYPFKENASFISDNPLLDKIWNTGWRTAKLCAFETYYDCPYYEQLQYIGDTRIQALISLYVSGDDRLVRKALNLFHWSINSEGLTQSRYPSNENQIIPTYSLFWISMIHDYHMLRGDSIFISTFAESIENILLWYKDKIDDQTNMLGYVPYWNFVDWAAPWPWNGSLEMGGYPPGMLDGGSSILTLQFAYTIDQAIDLFKYLGKEKSISKWQELSDKLKEATYTLCFDEDKMLMADDIATTSFSQHANIMGILSGCIPQSKQRTVMENILSDKSLIQATFYYQFYLTRALKITGMADKYVSLLEPWERMLDIGLTTFAEQPEPTRSDCHAWSASPNYDFLATICGIESTSPGFSTVRIQPSLGDLSFVQGQIPHPNGQISVSLTQNNVGGLAGEILLPNNTQGEFIYKNKKVGLHAGENKISPFAEFMYAKIDTSLTIIDIEFSEFIHDKVSNHNFIASINGSDTIAVQSVDFASMDSSRLLLLLNQEIQNTDLVFITFVETNPESRIIPFSDMPVDNLLNGSAPLLFEAQTKKTGESVLLYFNKPMSLSGMQNIKLILSSNNLDELVIADYSYVEGDSNTVEISVENQLWGEDIILASYTGNEIHSTDKGKLKPFEEYQITNTLKPKPPIITSAKVVSIGTEVQVLFSKEMRDAFNYSSNFEIKVNGNLMDIKLIKTTKNTVSFYPYFPIQSTDEVIFSYHTGEFSSMDGGLLEDISNFQITNNIEQVANKVPGVVQVENYVSLSGVDMEISAYKIGDIDLVLLHVGNWIDYSINVASDGYYIVDFLYYQDENEGEIILQTAEGSETKKDTIVFPANALNSGWTNLKDTIFLAFGIQEMKLTVSAEMNRINLISFRKTNLKPVSTQPEKMKVADDEQVCVFPNPCQDVLTISAENCKYGNISLMNSMGQVMERKIIENFTKYTLPCNSFPNGMYYLKIVTQSGLFSKGVCIQH